jgi:hypothetical protein
MLQLSGREQESLELDVLASLLDEAANAANMLFS